MLPLDRRTFLRLSTGAGATAFTASVGSIPALAHPAAPSAGDAAADDPAPPPARQFRAMWLSSVENIDWPSAPGLSVAQQKEEYLSWLDLAEELGLNAVIAQVRPTADAFWPSSFEPWSAYLTGTQGEDPGYDPLAFQIEAAHERSLEYHAWFNPYRVAMTEEPDLVEDHPARVHPDWVWPFGGKLYYDPGLPEVRAFVQDAMMDAVSRYDVDGAHFDDYFYPYPVEGQTIPDEDTFAAHSDGTESIEDWRRGNIDLLVSEMHERIRAEKPWVRFGISPFGIWRNATSDPEGSDTSGSESYEIISADSLRWVRERWVDYINPQIYWEIGHPAADYETLVHWWADKVEGTGVALYIGEAAYKAIDGTFPEATELGDHLDLTQTLAPIDGNVYFSAASLRDDAAGAVDDLVERHYAHPAIVTVIEGTPGEAPEAPTVLAARNVEDGVQVRWRGRAATSYALWRLPSATAGADELADGRNLVATVRAGRTSQALVHEGADGSGYYVVTAYDRTWRQSDPSEAVQVRG
ncbi:glycoside hydrolase family 10 protein [Brachybacterium alimentarium]|uniref:glycoside hydrolase family 10 protein n=1 Tax=Brachybacterium alimentarium TaxID=47845 RepID=UPI001C69A5EA|nr:family 10 glycosylhydrolase [Brachybacterium alimentarium]